MARYNKMARRTRFTPRYRKRYNKRSTGGWKSFAWKMAKKAARSVVGYYVNTEKKFNDYSISATSVPYDNMLFSNMSALTQGTADGQRIGDQIKVTNLQLRYSIFHNAAFAGTIRWRIIMFVDTQANGVLPAWSDVLEGGAASMESFNNSVNARRFIKLYDRVKYTNPTGTGNNEINYTVNKSIPKGIKVEYKTNAGTYADITTNSIWLMVFCDQPVAGSPGTFASHVRVRYIDN